MGDGGGFALITVSLCRSILPTLLSGAYHAQCVPPIYKFLESLNHNDIYQYTTRIKKLNKMTFRNL